MYCTFSTIEFYFEGMFISLGLNSPPLPARTALSRPVSEGKVSVTP